MSSELPLMELGKGSAARSLALRVLLVVMTLLPRHLHPPPARLTAAQAHTTQGRDVVTYTDNIDYFAEIGQSKAAALARAPGAFMVGALLGGAYIGIALILALTVSSGLPAGVRPMAAGAVFGLGLAAGPLRGGRTLHRHRHVCRDRCRAGADRAGARARADGGGVDRQSGGGGACSPGSFRPAAAAPCSARRRRSCTTMLRTRSTRARARSSRVPASATGWSAWRSGSRRA